MRSTTASSDSAEPVTDIASTVLADQRVHVWISHAAQRSILSSSDKGVAPTTLDTDRRIWTLVNTETDRSVGLITEAQLSTIARSSLGKGNHGPTELDADHLERQLSRLHRHFFDPSLLLTLKNILGPAPELTFVIRT